MNNIALCAEPWGGLHFFWGSECLWRCFTTLSVAKCFKYWVFAVLESSLRVKWLSSSCKRRNLTFKLSCHKYQMNVNLSVHTEVNIHSETEAHKFRSMRPTINLLEEKLIQRLNPRFGDIFFAKLQIKQRLLMHVLQGNSISVFLLALHSIQCYLPFHSNYVKFTCNFFKKNVM